MNRRQFIFRTLQSAALLSPIMSMRFAEANMNGIPKRLLTFVDAGTPYVEETDFFPTNTGAITQLAHNLAGFSGLENDMVIVNGVSFDQRDTLIRGNWHVSSVGQCLTGAIARDIGGRDGVHTGPSIDFVVANGLNTKLHVCNVSNEDRGHMRNRPFARQVGGQVDFNLPIVTPLDAWNNVFGGIDVGTVNGGAVDNSAILNRLRADKSILDATLDDLNRFRAQLVGDERVKLDIHLDAIRTAELGIQRDINNEAANNTGDSGVTCSPFAAPNGPGDNDSGSVNVNLVPQRSQTHFDILFAGFACQLIGVGGLMLGYSGESDEYDYGWVPGVRGGRDFHGDVWHEGQREHTENRLAAQWQWGELAKFCQRLKATPEGSGTMLDSVLTYGTSIFGTHHATTRVPAVLIGNAQGDLETGRYIRLNNTEHHAKVLTSVAHLMGVPVSGMGDHPNSGTLSQLGV